MLILPLHKPLTLGSFPVATMLLVMANVLVFCVFQAGDDARLQAAHAYYLEAGLGDYEAPAYARHLQQRGQGQAITELQATSAPLRSQHVATATLTDAAFVAALEDGRLFDTPEQWQQWQPLRRHYQGMLDDVFTLRHLLRSSEWSPSRMLSSAFLHGGVMHLLGNLLFLVALGLLLEGALGPARLLAVYLLGALGASAVCIGWRWGQSTGGLGASGAVAALMGAFCVVWGRRPVRFFYWFGVVFDYVRAPAIWLLPLWLGWEIYNLLVNSDKEIGFDAHAGGLLCGALMGAVLVLTRQVRDHYLQDEAASAPVDDRWQQAQRHLGRMQNAEAERLLAALALEQPGRADIALARYRAAANAGQAAALRLRALELLECPSDDAGMALAQRDALRGLIAQPRLLAAGQREQLLEMLISRSWLVEAEALLQDAASGEDADERRARYWFRIALRHGEQGDAGQQRRILQLLSARYPQQSFAAKARFLLEND